MHYIILDLEATCWEERTKNKNEIIEIGAVKINANAELVSEFQTFVRPTQHPELSEFCKSLTSISQSDVDAAPHFPEALQQFQEWFDYGRASYLLCSWGFYDKRQFKDDCKLHGLDADWVKPHISVKHQYGIFKKLERPVGMKQALQMEGIALEGTHHRGIDDARNIAKIFVKYFGEWEVSGVR
ncbi:3'-5' exonuclease [Flavilitoribacter nigricans]|uniref:3'-5' exonuclease n=1 Tax=Flavilitoribacter nigricans (strain ATCC 23147 / DSM 23189 / NBRC 102662 / NCIMB 1420 / SS-2) TaxID=1122177 RepID=A0A2D0NIC3_FLAN2|nr:3'-5' exonuclease [Flavilitoribacter nigricans]PHN08241.1 3'-5' exonuclease [Flavilitoribacter nigricans DSM 23189 = NBRC 102662]